MVLVLLAILLMMRRTNALTTSPCSVLPYFLCLLAAAVYGLLQAFLTVYARVRMCCKFEWKVTQRLVKQSDRARSRDSSAPP